MEDPVVIVNPRSGGGLTERRWAQLVGPLREGLGRFETRFTERSGDGRRIAAEEAGAGRGLVVAFGGDGTISEVADGVISAGSRSVLGFIPRGTGGDFRRTLELPKDLAEAAQRVRTGATRTLDAGLATFVGHDGGTVTRHFVNVASFGFSSAVAVRANASSKRLGAKASFLTATVRSLVTYENTDVIVSVDGGEPVRTTVLLGAVGNGRFFGGGMKICPDSLLDDGLLDLVTVGDFGRMEIVAKIHHIYDGTHMSLRRVRASRGRRIDVRPADPSEKIPIELDGETPGYLPASFEVLPAALRLRV